MATRPAEPDSWAERARAIVRHLADVGGWEPAHQGYADALVAAGIALDLAQAAGQSGQVEYARRGWVATLQLLTPPPRATPEPRESGVNHGKGESEFDRLARDFFGTGGGSNADVPHPA